MEFGFSKFGEDLTKSYPYRVFGTGDPSSLNVILRIRKSDIDPVCSSPAAGFKILFHKPNEYASSWNRLSLLSPNTSKTFRMIPKIQKAMNNIRKYSPTMRECYFSNENPLRFFKQYSQYNCKLECFGTHLMKRCGCVNFSMPSK